MSKVVEFKAGSRVKKASNREAVVTQGMYQEAVERDITNLCNSFENGIDRARAVEIAADFYRKYPMLIEMVRSPEYMLRRE